MFVYMVLVLFNRGSQCNEISSRKSQLCNMAKNNDGLKSKGFSQLSIHVNLTSFCGPAIALVSEEEFTIDLNECPIYLNKCPIFTIYHSGVTFYHFS